MEWELLPVTGEEARVDLLEGDLRRNFTGDVDSALSDDERGLCSAFPVLPFAVSMSCLVGISTELTEFRDFRPRVGVVDAVTLERKRPPSAADRGREEAFERLPFGTVRVIDDTVGLEAMGAVGVFVLSAAVTVRLGGIPFFGDALCGFSSLFLADAVVLLALSFWTWSIPLTCSTGQSAMVTGFPGTRQEMRRSAMENRRETIIKQDGR